MEYIQRFDAKIPQRLGHHMCSGDWGKGEERTVVVGWGGVTNSKYADKNCLLTEVDEDQHVLLIAAVIDVITLT